MKNMFTSIFMAITLAASAQQIKATDQQPVSVDLSRLPKNCLQRILIECDYKTVNDLRLVSPAWRTAIDHPRTAALLPSDDSQVELLLRTKSPLEVFRRASNTQGGLLRLASLDVFFPTWFNQCYLTEDDRTRIGMEVVPLLRDGGTQIPNPENPQEFLSLTQYCGQLKLLFAANRSAYDTFCNRLLHPNLGVFQDQVYQDGSMSLQVKRDLNQLRYCTTFSWQIDIVKFYIEDVTSMCHWLIYENTLTRSEKLKALKQHLSVFKVAQQLDMNLFHRLKILGFMAVIYDMRINKNDGLGIDSSLIQEIVIGGLNTIDIEELFNDNGSVDSNYISIIQILDGIKISLNDPRLNEALRTNLIKFLKTSELYFKLDYLRNLSSEQKSEEVERIADALKVRDNLVYRDVLNQARLLNALNAYEKAAGLIRHFLILDQQNEAVREVMDEMSPFELSYLLGELADTGDQVSLKRVTSLLTQEDLNRCAEQLQNGLPRVANTDLISYADVLACAGATEKARSYFKLINPEVDSDLDDEIKYLQLGLVLGELSQDECIRRLSECNLLSDDAYGEILDESLNAAFLYKVLGQANISEKLVERYILSRSDAITALQSLIVAIQAGLVDSKFCENILLTRFADISEDIKYDPTIPQDINKWILILYIHHLAGNKEFAEKMWQEIYEKHLSTKHQNRFRPLIIELLLSNVSIDAEEDARAGFIKTGIDSGSYEGFIAAFDAFFAEEMKKWNKEHHQ